MRARSGIVAVCALALMGAGGGDPPAPGVHWFKGSLTQARERARAENKLVLLDAWARWCAPCFALDREVWSLDALARALDREVVAVKVEVDRQTGVGREVGDTYGIYTLPHILVIDPVTGAAIERLEGVQPPSKIIEMVDAAGAKVGGAALLEKAGDDTGALVRAAGRLARTDRRADAARALERVRVLDADCARDDADDAALLLADLAVREKDTRRALAVLEEATTVCRAASGTRELWSRLLALAREGVAETGLAETGGAETGGAEAGGTETYGRLLARQVEQFPDEIAPRLALGQFLVRERSNAAAAEPHAQRAVELDPADPRSLALLAEVRQLQGKADEARDLIDRAIKLDPHDPDLRELRLRFARSRPQG